MMRGVYRSIARPVARSIARRDASAGGAISASIGGGFAISGVDTLSVVVSGLEGGETVAYQWTADAVDVSGATASTFAPTIGVNVSDADLIRCVVTVDGTEYTSNTRTVAYPAGAVTESAVSDWTIDDDALNVNLATDFTLPNLTGTFVMAGLPSGVVDDGDGSLSGTANGSPEAVNFTVTFTDQYGRGVVGSYSTNTVYRAQATATGGLGPFSFTVDSAITPQDLTTDFTANGNTLTYSVSPALPAGLSLATNGTLSGTPTAESASASYTVTAQDEYGRTTDSVFSLATAYRTQATAAGALGPFSFDLDSAITPQNLAADFTTNGNTLTYSVSPTLPTGLSLATNGTLSGTPTVESASASYTVTGQDEYGRDTDSVFSLEVVDGATWTPASLFASGEAGAWYEPSPTTCYTDTGRTTPAGAGDSVAAMDDLSGNGYHITIATASQRPLLQQTAGGMYYLSFDGVADLMVASLDAFGRFNYVMAYDPDGSDFLVAHRRPFINTGFVGVGQSGSSSTVLDDAVFSQIDFYVDGASAGASTRGEQYTAVQGGNVVDVLGDLVSDLATYERVVTGYYTSTLPGPPGDLYGFVVREELSGADRTALATYMGGLLS